MRLYTDVAQVCCEIERMAALGWFPLKRFQLHLCVVVCFASRCADVFVEVLMVYGLPISVSPDSLLVSERVGETGPA